MLDFTVNLKQWRCNAQVLAPMNVSAAPMPLVTWRQSNFVEEAAKRPVQTNVTYHWLGYIARIRRYWTQWVALCTEPNVQVRHGIDNVQQPNSHQCSPVYKDTHKQFSRENGAFELQQLTENPFRQSRQRFISHLRLTRPSSLRM